MFDARKCLAEMEEALIPVIQKYRSQMAPKVQEQLTEGLITSVEALNSLIDPVLDREFYSVK